MKEMANKYVYLFSEGNANMRELLARADYVTEMKKLRHPYDRGTAARQGVEW